MVSDLDDISMTLLVLVNIILNVRLIYSHTVAVHLFNTRRTSMVPSCYVCKYKKTVGVCMKNVVHSKEKRKETHQETKVQEVDIEIS